LQRLIVLSGLVLAIACLYRAQAVLIPLALAILLSALLSPVVGMLQRLGPSTPASGSPSQSGSSSSASRTRSWALPPSGQPARLSAPDTCFPFEALAQDRFLVGDPVRMREEIARYRDRLVRE